VNRAQAAKPRTSGCFRARSTTGEFGALGALQIAIATAVVLGAPLFPGAERFIRLSTIYFGNEWSVAAAAQFAASFAILIVPTILFGAQFPVASRLATSNVASAGGRVGLVYGVNVLVGIAGALVTGFALLPLLGAQKSLWLLAFALAATGFALIGLEPFRPPRLALAFVPALLAAVFSWDVSKRLHETWLVKDERIGFYREGAAATVMVAEYPPGIKKGKRILVNGSSASNSTQ
jgi:spermidine synthase